MGYIHDKEEQQLNKTEEVLNTPQWVDHRCTGNYATMHTLFDELIIHALCELVQGHY